MKFRAIISLVAVFALSACDSLLPVNPYDPAAPPLEQAKGQVEGTVLLNDAELVDADDTRQELWALSFNLTTLSGQDLSSFTCDDSANLVCDSTAKSAHFVFRDVGAGDYLLRIDGIDPRYDSKALPQIRLAPGEHFDFGILSYEVTPVDPENPNQSFHGIVDGRVTLSAGSGAGCALSLLRKTGNGLQAFASQLSGPDGAFRFENLPPGTYGLSAELENFTPDYRAGFEIPVGVSPPVVHFDNSDALTLHPVTAVLIPSIQQTFGHYYTNEHQVPIQVLQFGGMNQMRLSTREDFCLDVTPSEDCADEVEWQAYSASAVVDLPEVEGEVPIYAQFKNTQVDGFTFVSSVYQTQVIRDVTPPSIEAVSVRGHQAADDGKIWFSQESAILSIDVDASDANSGVYSLALYHDDDNASPADPSSLSFILNESPAGLVRLNAEQGLTAGEGQKTVYVYLKDRAGNISAAGSIEVWVDATAPVVEQFVLNNAVSISASHIVPVAINASDSLSQVVGMKIWEEGQSEPESFVSFASDLSFSLQPLDYAQTQRQVNVVVVDLAGNISTQSSAGIALDDRGVLHGKIYIDPDSQGNVGDVSGLSCLINGQTYPLASSGEQSPFDFVIADIPQASNLRLRFAKPGYAPVQTASLYSVVANMTTEISEVLRLRPAHGSLAGYVHLQDETNWFGIQVRIVGTQQTVATDSNGYFIFPEVTAKSGYSINVSNGRDWSQWIESGIEVQADTLTMVWPEGSPLELTALQGDFYISEGLYTSSTLIHLGMQYDDATSYWAGETANSPSPVPWQAFSNNHGLYDYALASGDDGNRTVYAKFDTPTGETPVRQDSIVLDRVKPEIQELLLNNGSEYTAANTVQMSAAIINSCAENRICAPVNYYRISQYTGDDASMIPANTWGPFKAWNGQSVSVVLDSSQQFYTARVWLQVMDAAQNRSAPKSATIIKDENPPTDGSIVINEGDSITNNFIVRLALTANDDTNLKMLIADDSTAGADVWKTYSSSTSWTLPPASQGTKQVCVKFKDAAGNESSQEYCDTIDYDSIAPDAPNFTIAEGAYVSATTVHLQLSNAVTDVDEIQVASNAAFSGAQLSAPTTVLSYTLSEPDGSKVIYVRYQDEAGNFSPVSVQNVVLDRVAPSASLVLQDADPDNSPAYTASVNITALVQQPSLDAVEMLLGEGADCSTGSWEAISTRAGLTLTSGDALKTVHLQVKDRAGLRSPCYTQTITLDTQAPTLSAVVLGQVEIVLTADQSAVQYSSCRVDLSTGGSPVQMKLSNQPGVTGAAWQSFTGTINDWQLEGSDDGTKTVYAQLRDEAGNVSAVQSGSVVVDSTGEVTGQLVLEGSNDFSDVVISLAGQTDGAWTIDSTFVLSDVLQKTYVPLQVSKPGYDDVLLSSGVRVMGGSTVNVGKITLVKSRGSVAGNISLSGETRHGGILVENLGTGQTTLTNTEGHFNFDEVLVGSYNFRLSKDGYSTRVVGPFDVNSGVQTSFDQTLTPQQGDFTINDDDHDGIGASFVTALGVTLNLNYTDAVSYRASEQDLNGVSTTTLHFGDFSACSNSGSTWDCPFDLADLDGSHKVYVQFTDSNGIASAVFESEVTLDREPPEALSLLINDGAAASADLNVLVALSASDATSSVEKIQFSTDGSNYETPVTFFTPYTYALTGAEGEKCLYAKFIDSAGLVSTTAVSDCIVHDTTAPTGLVAITDPDGNDIDYSQSEAVYLRVTTTDAHVEQMKISNNSSLSDVSWQPYSSDLQPWTLAGGDGTRNVYVALKDWAGNISTAMISDSVVVDQTAPAAPEFSVDEGEYSNSRTIHLSLNNRSQGSPAEVMSVQIFSNRDLGLIKTLTPSESDLSFDLPDEQGLHLINVRYIDAAGNQSEMSQASIVFDNTAPDFLDLSCLNCVESGGQLRTNSASLSLGISATGADLFKFTGNVLAPTPNVWQPSVAFVDVTLDVSSGEGDKVITLALQDLAGNVSVPVSKSLTIYYDPNPPSCTVSLQGYLADGLTPAPAGYSATSNLQVIANCSGNPQGMAIVPASETLDCATARYTSFASSSSLQVASGDGNRNIKACFIDATGNTSASPVSDASDIVLDQTVPQSANIMLDGGAAYTNASAPHTVSVSSDVSGASQVRYSTDGAFDTEAWQNWPATNSVDLPTGSGERVVYAMFRDALQNTTAVVSDSIILDLDAPADGTVLLAGGQSLVNTQSISINISDTNPDFMRFWEVASTSACGSSSCGVDTYTTFSPSMTFTLSADAGDKRVCWHFCDQAGNGSAVGQSDIELGTYLDRPQPVLSSLSRISIEALSNESGLEPRYPLTLTGTGIAADTRALIGDFSLVCNSSGGEACVDGDASSCASECTVSLPKGIMRNAGTYLVRLQTPAPVVGGLGTSADSLFFSVVSPRPVITQISPRGVLQAIENGQPKAQQVSITIKGYKFMDNVQFLLGSNNALVQSFDEDPTSSEDSARIVTIRVSTADLWPLDLVDTTFAAVNPSPGGGEDRIAFGINPEHTNCLGSECISNLRWTRVESTGARGVYQDYQPETQASVAMLWRGGQDAKVLSVSGLRLAEKRSWSGLQRLLPVPSAASLYRLEALAAAKQHNTVMLQPAQKRANGQFDTPVSSVSVGDQPIKVLFFDMNMDGNLDVLSLNQGSENVSLCLNNGAVEIFSNTNCVLYSTGSYPQDMNSADLNGDGAPDLLVMADGNIEYRLNDGQGLLGRFTYVSIEGGSQFEVADLDQDGAADIVLSHNDTFRVAWGNGRGAMAPMQEYRYPGNSFNAIAVSDFNGDDMPDLALTDQTNKRIAVLLGQGGRTFSAPDISAEFADSNMTVIRVADLNMDGLPDLVVNNENSTPETNVGIFWGQGAGRFSNAQTVGLPFRNVDVAIADQNGDGKPDVLVWGIDDRLYLLAGDGQGNFTAEPSFLLGSNTSSNMAIGDYNNDGVLDFAAPFKFEAKVSFTEGMGNTIALPQTYPLDTQDERQFAVRVADMNSDGHIDIMTANHGRISFFAGIGVLNFASAQLFGVGYGARDIEVLDSNGDDNPDVLSPEAYFDELANFLGDGAGNLTRYNYETSTATVTGDSPDQITVGDLNEDGAQDFLTINSASNNTSVFLWQDHGDSQHFYGVQDGTDYRPNAIYSVGVNPVMAELADLNLDGHLDFVALNSGGATLSIRLGDGTGSLLSEQTVSLSPLNNPLAFAVGDLNGDNYLDFFVTSESGNVAVLLGLSNGQFAAPSIINLGQWSLFRNVLLRDLNGDDVLDLVLVANWDNSVVTSYGAGDGSFGELTIYSTSAYPQDVDVVDLNQDGSPDLLICTNGGHELTMELQAPERYWSQYLEPMAAQSITVPAASSAESHIYQAGQQIEQLAVMVKLQGDDYGGVQISLRTPSGDVIPLDAGTNWSGGQPWHSSYTESSVDFSAVVAHYEPEGYWDLIVDNTAGSQSLGIEAFALSTLGSFIKAIPGSAPNAPKTITYAAGQKVKYIKGRTLGHGDHHDPSCNNGSAGAGPGEQWFESQWTTNNTLTMQVVANFDAVLSVYEGSCASLGAELACDDDSGFGFSPALSALSDGAYSGTVCIVVDGAYDNAGTPVEPADDTIAQGDYDLKLIWSDAPNP